MLREHKKKTKKEFKRMEAKLSKDFCRFDWPVLVRTDNILYISQKVTLFRALPPALEKKWTDARRPVLRPWIRGGPGGGGGQRRYENGNTIKTAKEQEPALNFNILEQHIGPLVSSLGMRNLVC